MENLINQFFEILRSGNENEIKKFINEPQNGIKMPFVEYLVYTQNIDVLKLLVHYINYNPRRKINCILDYMDESNDIDLNAINENNYAEVLNNVLNRFQKNINNEEIELFNAIITDNANEIKEIINHNPKLINASYFNRSPLAIASTYNCPDACKMLLELVANVNYQDNNDGTTLMYAAENGNIDIVKKLLEYEDINVNLQNTRGDTALMRALLNGNIDVVKELLKYRDINVNLQGNSNATALLIATQRGYIDIVDTLLRAGANIEAADINGWTALMRASRRGDINMTNKLIEFGANTETSDVHGRTALVHALETGRINIVDTLLQNNSNINAVDENGYNVLLQAIEMGYDQRMIAYLCRHGAIIDINARSTYIAYLHAVIRNKENIVRFLDNLGVSMDNINFDDKGIKQELRNSLAAIGVQINIEDISNANRDFIIRTIDIANANFGERMNSQVHSKNAPIKDFIDFGISIVQYDLTQEEKNNLNGIVARFDGAIANRNQQEIRNSINELFELCKTNKNIYDIVNVVIDKNVIYRDNKKSLTKLLNIQGFDTKEFNIKLKTLQKFKEVHMDNNMKMNDGTKMSMLNKCFQLVYRTEFGEEIDALSQNIIINNAYLTYQQDKTENDKNNLINIIIHNMDNDTKKSIFEDLSDFGILDGNKKIANLERTINAMTDSDLGTCLKNRLKQELQLNNLENVNNALNNNQNQLQ